MELTREQKVRYARHLVLEGVGEEGQKKLLQAKVLVIGAGALGSAALLYLAAAGVGTIGIADGDVVDISNLQRQIIHTAERHGRRKTESARNTLEALNPEVTIREYPYRLDETNIGEVLRDYDFVVDAADTFTSKLLINDACVRAKKPFVHAGIVRFGGQIMTYVPGMGPCFRCVCGSEPEAPAEVAATVGVLGAATGVMGSLEAMEAIKYIVGAGDLLVGRVLFFDGLTMETQILEVAEAHPACLCQQIQ